MSYDPKLHHRRSIRLKGYDYSQEGLYFITISAHHMQCFFGKVVNHRMILNDGGKMVEKWVEEMKNKYPNIDLGEYVVMPNHFHCIIEILSGKEEGKGEPMKEEGAHTGAPRQVQASGRTSETYGMDNKKYNATIGTMVDWLTTMSTNEYIRGVKTLAWQPFDKKLWHRNYWEHIIRTQQSYQNISGYIMDNPTRWKDDKFHQF